MKILRLYSKLPPKPGGMEQHIKQLSIEQGLLGHQVDIYFHAGEKVSENDVQLCRCFNLFCLRFEFLIIIFFHLSALFYCLRHRKRYDLIHVHGDWSALVILPLIKYTTHAKGTVLTIHDELRTGFLHRYIFPILCRQLNGIFCTGNSVKTKWNNTLKPPITFQPSGIRQLFYADKTQQKSTAGIITVANLVGKKRIDRILKIARLLPEESFLIAGDGALRAHLESDKPDNVIFLGQTQVDELQSLLESAAIFLLTSDNEGTPTAMLEALASGCAVVSSNAGGVKTILSNASAIVIDDADDILAYRQAIEELLTKKEQKKAMIENPKIAQPFRWNIVAQNITRQCQTWLA